MSVVTLSLLQGRLLGPSVLLGTAGLAPPLWVFPELVPYHFSVVLQGKWERVKPFGKGPGRCMILVARHPELFVWGQKPAQEAQESVDMLSEGFMELVCWHQEPQRAPHRQRREHPREGFGAGCLQH